jgi:hypothetical protein
MAARTEDSPNDPSEVRAIRIVASDEARQLVLRAGGLVFVWPRRSVANRLALTTLETSCEPPPGALDFRRFEANGFLAFLHPSMQMLPRHLELQVRGWRRRRVAAFWNGLAYVM